MNKGQLIKAITEFLEQTYATGEKVDTDGPRYTNWDLWNTDFIKPIREILQGPYADPKNPVVDEIREEDYDFASNMFESQIRHIQLLSYNEGPFGQILPNDCEPDEVIIQIRHHFLHNEDLTMEMVAIYILRIFAFLDCTGCCDAITHILVGKESIMLKIQSGHTYHS